MPEAIAERKRARWPASLRALANRNFQLFFVGQGISLAGTWMQQTAMSWLVYRLTGSTYLLGAVAFAGQIPVLFLAPVAGVVTDRWHRHRLLILTQTLAMLQAFAMAAVAWRPEAGLRVASVIALSALLGVVNAFDMTVRQAFLNQMVERPDDLANAIALNSSLVNGARLVGPALGGILVDWVGEASCFLLNGISYFAVIAALLAMRVPAPDSDRAPQAMWHGLREGWRYTFGFPPIRSILLLLALVSMAGLSYSVLLPVYARDVLGGGARTLGLLSGAAGVGALGGAMYLASRKTVLGLGLRVAVAPLVLALAVTAFAYSRLLPLSLAFLAVAGFAVMVLMAASNTILQTIVDEDKRGRVMSFYAAALLGMAPLGSLAAGWLAGVVGAERTLLFGAGLCAAGGLAFAIQLRGLRGLVRPIYARKGILPPVAEGIQAATQMAVPPEAAD